MKTKQLFISCAAAVMVAAAVPATAATPPSISEIIPNVGAPAGGNTVIITGHNFVPQVDYTDALSGAQYAPLEYLTFTGTQYINSGVKNNGVIDAEVDFKFASSSGSGTLFGAAQTNPNFWLNAFAYRQLPNDYYLYNVTSAVTWQPSNNSIAANNTNRHTFSKKGNTAQLDAVSITSNVGTMALVGTYDFYVGASNLKGSPTYYLKGNIYSFTFWCNDVLVRNYVPVFNIATGEKGLFDIANNKFYGSDDGAFDNAYAVTFDGIAASNVVVVSNDTITCTVPAHAVGTVDVAESSGDETDTLKLSYTYLPDTITVTPRDTFKVYGTAADPVIPYTLTDYCGHDMTGATVGSFDRAAGEDVGEYRLTFNPADWTFANHVFKFDTAGVRFTITKAKRAFKDSTVSVTYSAGLTLGSIPLTSHYAWITASTPLTAADSGNMFSAKYIDPVGNYYDTTSTIQVNISKAAAGWVDTTINVTYSPGLMLASLLSAGSKYAWQNPSTALSAGSGQSFAATYTASSNHAAEAGNITVNVNQAAGSFTHADIYVTYTPGLKLSDVALSGTDYAWDNGNQVLNATDSGRTYSAAYTDPSGNYATATGLVKVHISKAVYAVVDIPPHFALTAVYTSTNTLSDVIGLQSGYSWATPTQKLTVAQSSYAAKYNADPANYNDFSLDITVNVTPGIGSASVSLNDWTYGTPDTLVVTSTTNGTAGVTYMYDSITGSTYHSATQPKNVGSYKVTATFAATTNYTAVSVSADFEITKAPLAVSTPNVSCAQGYIPATFAVNYTGFKNGETATVITTASTASTTATADSLSGNYPITLTKTDAADNYTFTYTDGVLTVTNKILVAVVWSDTLWVYNGAAQQPTATVTIGTTKSLTVSGAQTNVGTYTATAALEAADDLGYALSNPTHLFKIVPDTVKVTARDTFKIYGSSDPALPYTRSKNLVAGSFSGALERAAGKNVGTYAITQGNLTAGSNYYIDFVGADFTITKKTLTVTADNKTKTQGAANPTLTLTYSGWEYGDNKNSLTTQPTVSTDAVKESTANDYAITVSGGVADNYDFVYVPGTLTITDKRTATVVWDSLQFTYDGSAHKPTATVTIDGTVVALEVSGEQTDTGTYTAYAYFSPANDTTTLSGDTVQFSITPDTTTLDTLLVFETYAVVKLGYNAIFLHLRKLRENIGFRPLECEWYHNGNLIGTGFVHSAGPTRQHKIEPGNYTFKLIGDSAVYYSTPQYLEVKFKSALSIYPNPISKEQLHIGNVRMLTLENASNSPTVEIYDIKGVLVLELPLLPLTSDNTATIDVSRLRAGVYIVKVGENISKVVVQ